MKFNRTIIKYFFIAAWLTVGGAIMVLLIAANDKEEKHLCKSVIVSITSTQEHFYIEKESIIEALQKETNGSLINKEVSEIDLSQLEKKLEKNSWIADAELYFDSRANLHVKVTERQPVARVFTKAGNSFYMDSSGVRMPLLDNVNVRVPVVTNFTNAKKLNAADSALLNDVKEVLQYIINDDFWNAQIAQVDIVDDKVFELIPVVGNHTIKVGNADDIEEKLHRLYVFYEQVLSKTGFDKYKVLDVQYDGQVVAVHKGPASAIDSIQLKKNIKELLENNLSAVEENYAKQKSEPMHTSARADNTKEVVNPPVQSNPHPVKTTQSNPVVKKEETKKRSTKPKAVMPKKNQ